MWRLGSLTKSWACPGLRLGYALAPDDESADLLRRRRPQWSVSSLALAVVEPMLERTDLPAWATDVAALRRSFAASLTALGFDVTDTEVNWILVVEPRLRERLIPHGVLVRDCSNFGLPGVARVAVPRAEEFERVLRAFERVRPS